MSCRDRYYAACHSIRTIGRRRHSGLSTDCHVGMHLAVHSRFGSLSPPVCHNTVSHCVVPAGFRSQLAAHRTGGYLHQAVIGRIAVQDILLVQALVDLAHVGLPQRRGRAGTCGLGGQCLIVVMTDPQGGSVVSGHTGEEYALLVGVCTGLTAHDLSADLCACTGTALYRGLQHVYDQPGSAGRENLAPFLVLVSIPYHIICGIGNTQHGYRLLVNAAVGQYAEGNRHLQRGNTGGTKAQAEGSGIDVAVVNTQPVQEVHAAFHAHIGHKCGCRGCIMRLGHGSAQGFRTHIAASAVVLRPGIVSLGILPAGNRYRHVVNHRGRAAAQFQGRCVNRNRLDGRTDRHLHVRSPVQGLPCCHFSTGTDNRLQLTRPVIQHRAGRLWLNGFCIGAVGVLCPEHLV